MNRLRKLFDAKQDVAYEPLSTSITTEDGVPDNAEPALPTRKQGTFSYVEYSIFLLLGVSMLWAWNMFLASCGRRV